MFSRYYEYLVYKTSPCHIRLFSSSLNTSRSLYISVGTGFRNIYSGFSRFALLHPSRRRATRTHLKRLPINFPGAAVQKQVRGAAKKNKSSPPTHASSSHNLPWAHSSTNSTTILERMPYAWRVPYTVYTLCVSPSARKM